MFTPRKFVVLSIVGLITATPIIRASDGQTDSLVAEIYTALTISDRNTRQSTLRQLAKQAFRNRSTCEDLFWDVLTPTATDEFDDVVTAFAKVDLETTSRWLLAFDLLRQKHCFGPESTIFAKIMAELWLQQDLDTTRQWVDTLPPQRKALAVATLLPRWRNKSPAAALSWVSELQTTAPTDLLAVSIAGVWADIDPQAAFALVAESADRHQRAEGILAIVDRIARQSPETAVTWINQFPDKALAARAIERAQRIIFREVLAPEQATRVLSKLSPSPERNEALRLPLTTWFARDTNGARAWALAAPTPEDRRFFAGVIVERWARDHPRKAANWATQVVDPACAEEAVEEAVRGLISRSMAEDSLDAAKWAETIANPALREIAVRETARTTQRSRKEFSKTAEWAENLAQPELRSLAVKELVQATIVTDRTIVITIPEEITRVLQLSNTTARRTALRDAVTTWAQQDLDTAMSWASRISYPAPHDLGWDSTVLIEDFTDRELIRTAEQSIKKRYPHNQADCNVAVAAVAQSIAMRWPLVAKVWLANVAIDPAKLWRDLTGTSEQAQAIDLQALLRASPLPPPPPDYSTDGGQ